MAKNNDDLALVDCIISVTKNDKKNDKKNDYFMQLMKAPTDERSLSSSSKKNFVSSKRVLLLLLLRIIIIPRDRRQKRRRRTRGLVLGPVGASFRESFLRRRSRNNKSDISRSCLIPTKALVFVVYVVCVCRHHHQNHRRKEKKGREDDDDEEDGLK